MHIKGIYEDKELEEAATLKNFLTVRREGNRQVSRNLGYYNLDMIIAVGYRVPQWATAVLRDFAIRGTQDLFQFSWPRKHYRKTL